MYKKDKTMGAKVSSKASGPARRQHETGNHECEVFEGGCEAAESAMRWNNCTKNPGHTEFMSVNDFRDKHLLDIPCDSENFWAFINRTVRLRVQWTSPSRADKDTFSEYRGTDKLRLGTGFITSVIEYTPKLNKPCPCGECNGMKMRNYWVLSVRTAHHVVFNAEEAKKTKVDLFYNDESCHLDGRMKTVWALDKINVNPTCDVSFLRCVTHDATLVERIRDHNNFRISFDAPMPLFVYINCCKKAAPFDCRKQYTFIVSHPHGQPKKITMGELLDDWNTQYRAATCPGSSGANVVVINLKFSPEYNCDTLCIKDCRMKKTTHSGTFTKTTTLFGDQINYGYDWEVLLNPRSIRLLAENFQ